MVFHLKSGSKILLLDRPRTMGILNVTPDSFSDGGKFVAGDEIDVGVAVTRAIEMVEQGANIIDVGGESTGPGSGEVSVEDELARVIPVIRAIRERDPEVWISVDTWKAEVARQGIEVGADLVNDVTAFRGDSELVKVVKEAGVPVVLMYSKDPTARTTGERMEYEDVMATVHEFLINRIGVAEKSGIDPSKIVIDPGIGAFVSLNAKYSLEILERLHELEDLNCPILVGASRKSFIAKIWGGEKPLDRLEGSLAAAILAVQNGANIIRVHDARETQRVLDFWDAALD